MSRARFPPKRIFAIVLTILMALMVQRLFPQESQWRQFDSPVFLLLAGVIFSVLAVDERDAQLGTAFLSIALFFGVLSYIDFRFLGR